MRCAWSVELKDKFTMSKLYCGTYKGYPVYQDGQMIGNNWYGKFTQQKNVNGRHIRIKESTCGSINEIKAFVDKIFRQ